MFAVRRVLISVAAGLAMSAGAFAQQPDSSEDIETARAFLVEQVVAHARATAEITGREAIDDAVLEAIGSISRHEFVAPEAVPFSSREAADAFVAAQGGQVMRLDAIPDEMVLAPEETVPDGSTEADFINRLRALSQPKEPAT